MKFRPVTTEITKSLARQSRNQGKSRKFHHEGAKDTKVFDGEGLFFLVGLRLRRANSFVV
jgi:hypothetical protein